MKDTYYEAALTLEQSIARAHANGLDIVFAKPNELLIDIDNYKDVAKFWENHYLLDKYEPGLIAEVNVRPSKSGLPKRHITVTLNTTVSDLERIALQAMLGSDRKREMFSYLSMKQGHPSPTLFYEAKQKALPPALPEILTDEEIPFGNFHTSSDSQDQGNKY